MEFGELKLCFRELINPTYNYPRIRDHAPRFRGWVKDLTLLVVVTDKTDSWTLREIKTR